jgi:hypothetical protein
VRRCGRGIGHDDPRRQFLHRAAGAAALARSLRRTGRNIGVSVFAPPNPERSLIWPRITQDGSLGAWRRAHNRGAELATPFDSCSQRLAELVVLLLETSHSFHAAFLRNSFVPLRHYCLPVARDVIEPATCGRARLLTMPEMELPRALSSSSNVGAFAAGTASPVSAIGVHRKTSARSEVFPVDIGRPRQRPMGSKIVPLPPDWSSPNSIS